MGYTKKKAKKDLIRNPTDLSYINLKTDELDEWQKEVMNYWGNFAIRAGRQVGKSYITAKKAAQFALKHNGVKILLSASSERQAMFLYEKITYELRFCTDENVFAETPTMRRTILKNGSEIYCLPVGLTGDLIRGLTLDVWIPDECAYINRQVFVAVTPMLWISKKEKGMGWIWALSTPCGKQGNFYQMFNDPTFKTWHISSLECGRIPKDELEKWKKDFTKIQYAQEVLGEFIEEVSRLFQEEVLEKCFKDKVSIYENKFLGIDVARYGADKNAFVIATEQNKKISVTLSITTERKSIFETFKKVEELERENEFNKILIDDAGVGGGLTDFLIEKFKNKIVGINNASKRVDYEGKRGKGILKQDLYSNALLILEQGDIEILKDDELYSSLAHIQFEYDGEKIKIYGKDSHLAEAFVRALWGAKNKDLNSFVFYF